jgi:hypothetical protein
MKRLYLICAAVCCVTLTGCIVHDRHRHGLPAAKIVVPMPGAVGGPPAKACPPGQAKKGNCR